MVVTDYELEILKEVKDMLNDTHQYETELFEEITGVLSSGECDCTNSLLEWSYNQLNDTHCCDTEVFERLEEYIK